MACVKKKLLEDEKFLYDVRNLMVLNVIWLAKNLFYLQYVFRFWCGFYIQIS